jgi:glutamate synthase (NADPH/NADH) small chain
VYRQKLEGSYDLLSITNNFPEFTAAFARPCESACVLGINQPPITIEEIEKHIIEIAFDKGFVQPRTPGGAYRQKSGCVWSVRQALLPAQLNYAGHTVRVWSATMRQAVLLRYGIPDFKAGNGYRPAY